MSYSSKPPCAVIRFALMIEDYCINCQIQLLKDFYQLVALGQTYSLPGMTSIDSGLFFQTLWKKIWQAFWLIARCYESCCWQPILAQVTPMKLTSLWRNLYNSGQPSLSPTILRRFLSFSELSSSGVSVNFLYVHE